MRRRLVGGNTMRMRISLVAALFLGLAALAQAQMGGNWFTNPAILDLINPVVGKGAQYQTTMAAQENIPAMIHDVTVVGKETVDGREGFWLEIGTQGGKNAGYVKFLMSFAKNDFQLHRMITQAPGRQATEIVWSHDTTENSEKTFEKSMGKWQNAGTELITVPAGVFSCKHWHLAEADPNSMDTDIWTSDKVTPFGIVKAVGAKRTMVLLKLISDAQDHLTGPVKKLDPQEMIRQQMEKPQQKQQGPPQP
jgi:hypothetical protein